MKEYNEYELIYIVPLEEVENIDKIQDKIRTFIKNKQGEIIRESEPQKRKLAYSIKGSKSGVYLITRFLADRAKIQSLREQIGLEKHVLRHMIVCASELPEQTTPKEDSGEKTKKKEPQTAGETKKKTEEKDRKEAAPEMEKKITREKPKSKDESKELEKEEEPEKISKKAITKKENKEKDKKKKLRFEELDKKIDDILKDDLI